MSEEIQKKYWKSYLATGRGGKDLFHSIDTDGSGTVSVKELQNFLHSIHRDGVNDHGFDDLMSLAKDHPLNLDEFLSRLVLITQDEAQCLGSIKSCYETQPGIGIRRASQLQKQQSLSDDDDGKAKEYTHVWNETTMAQNLRKMQYAVRGEVVLKANLLQSQGREIVFSNLGNPHAVGQKPITYYRQILALCDLPAEYGVDHPKALELFPADVLERAKEYRSFIPGGTGSYSNSQGILGFREKVSAFISNRDQHPSFPGDIFLTSGASSGIANCLTALISSDHDAVMIPIPQYPIYSALLTLLGGRQVGYELDEENGWAVNLEMLEKSLADAKRKNLYVKSMVIINPGNPTGQVLDRKSLETICKFCTKNGIVLLSDEVYQRNVYAKDKTFISAKKVACECEGVENLELVSFHSTSKGLIGECGRRGGYMELHNISSEVHAQLYKLACSGLCPSIGGQIMTSLMVDPPKPGDISYDQFHKEEQDIFNSLVRRSASLAKGLNTIPGISCNSAEGAMYVFPSITIPEKAVEEAKKQKKSPDTLYCLSLLEETGICVVPASGFGQKAGRFGFRTTFLPPDDQVERAIEGFSSHHKIFCERYA